MSQETLPCPFCGRQPQLTTRAAANYEPGPVLCFVSCFNGGYTAHVWMRASGDTPEAAERDAIAIWNTRKG